MFYDRPEKESRLSKLLYSLLNQSLNSKNQLYLWEHWEHSYQGNIFGADCNRGSWFYEITQLRYWVMVVVEGGGWCKVFNICRRWEITKIEQVQTRGEGAGWGPKFWLFCEKVMIEWPLSRFSALSKNVLLIFNMRGLNGALFLKVSFLFIMLASLVPLTLILPFTTIYTSR